MAKVKIKLNTSSGSKGNLTKAFKSDHLAKQLEELATPILEAAKQDPNEYYVSTLDMHRFYSAARRTGRVSIQIGAAPEIGGLVEAKRGTLARAMGLAGF